jgi:hypothetical protein
MAGVTGSSEALLPANSWNPEITNGAVTAHNSVIASCFWLKIFMSVSRWFS